MPFQGFMEMAFFKIELEETKNGWRRKDSKNTKDLILNSLVACADFVKWNFGLWFYFGVNSPHIHTGFPGIARKCVICPANFFSIYQPQGMQKEMTWKQFKESVFYEKKKDIILPLSNI